MYWHVLTLPPQRERMPSRRLSCRCNEPTHGAEGDVSARPPGARLPCKPSCTPLVRRLGLSRHRPTSYVLPCKVPPRHTQSPEGPHRFASTPKLYNTAPHYSTPFPLPGTYESPGAIGLQRDSKKENQSRTVFGSSTRDQAAKMGCEEELLKSATYGRGSPGPCTYGAASGLGRQADSKSASSPAFKMGTQGRFSEKNPTRDVPGAGSYASATPAYGKQVQLGVGVTYGYILYRHPRPLQNPNKTLRTRQIKQNLNTKCLGPNQFCTFPHLRNSGAVWQVNAAIPQDGHEHQGFWQEGAGECPPTSPPPPHPTPLLDARLSLRDRRRAFTRSPACV